ncbi:MAG: hypothetical protein IKB34_06710 [Clostridia bacterium]|nr:hypothetical protein [Clostridia bacterium]
MNGYQLRDTVCALGFITQLDDEDSFFHAANLALSRLRTLIPLRKTVKICSFHPRPAEYRKSGESFTIHSPRGIGFYFEYTGSLTVSYTHGTDAFKEELSEKSGKYTAKACAFAGCDSLTLSFSGENAHSVLNACIYDRLSEQGKPELYSELYSYDMRNEDGFLSVLNVEGGDYTLRGSRVLIPRGESTAYTVEYSYAPPPLSYDTMNDELGIDPCLSEAAALLVAYYVWLDDDVAKAEKYRAEYDISVREILKRRQTDTPRAVNNGW